MDISKEELWKTSQRIRNLVRAVNVRRGLRRKDERPPEDHWAVRDEESEQALLSKYYEFKGWNLDGIPTREALEKLDLDYVADDFEQRGILEVREAVSA
jgi:aldehyde:ferredoxin oxidoreductase